MELSVIAPVYKTKQSLANLAQRLSAALHPAVSFELILVDDACPDGSWDEIKRLSMAYPWIKGIRLERNYGQHPAIFAGLQEASGEWLAVMDSDLQDRPEELPALLQKCLADNADMTVARRANRQDFARRRFYSFVFHSFISLLTGVQMDPMVGNFGVYSRRAGDMALAFPQSPKIFAVLMAALPLRRSSVAVRHEARQIGQSSYNFVRLLEVAGRAAAMFPKNIFRLWAKISAFLCLMAVFAAACHGGLAADNFSLFTLHFSPFTLHSSLFTLRPSLFTLHFSLFTFHFSLFTTWLALTAVYVWFLLSVRKWRKELRAKIAERTGW